VNACADPEEIPSPATKMPASLIRRQRKLQICCRAPARRPLGKLLAPYKPGTHKNLSEVHMKKLLLYFSLAAVALVLSLSTTVVRAHAQNSSAQPQPPPSAADPMPQQDQATAFTGTIVKEKGKLILKDTLSASSYQLDDQAKAQHYVGKQVKVIGKLDANTNVIHVQRIEEMAS
jgi:hypothetical protein